MTAVRECSLGDALSFRIVCEGILAGTCTVLFIPASDGRPSSSLVRTFPRLADFLPFGPRVRRVGASGGDVGEGERRRARGTGAGEGGGGRGRGQTDTEQRSGEVV